MFPPKEEADLTGFIREVVAIMQAAGRRNTLIA